MSLDSKYFLDGAKDNRVPLYEAKMFFLYNHRYGNYTDEMINSGQVNFKIIPTPIDEQLKDPAYTVASRFYVERNEVEKRHEGRWKFKWLLCFRGITLSVNERTAIFSILPFVAAGNSAPEILVKNYNAKLISCLLASFNSLVFDYVARQKIGHTNFNFFIFEQLPALPPNIYTSTDIQFITPRVLELVYTAYDLKPFAEDMGYHGEPFEWDEERRALLRAELDAYYARLYDLTRDELRYILDPKEVYGEDFPGETFRVLKDKEIRLYGEYRTRRLVLEAWDRLEGVQVAGYQVSGEVTPDDGLSSATGGLSTATSGLSTPTSGKSTATGGLSSPTSRPPSTTGGLSAATGGLSPTAREVKPVEENPAQPSFSDFGLYECANCGKHVMGFDQGKHVKEVHGGQSVKWKKIR